MVLKYKMHHSYFCFLLVKKCPFERVCSNESQAKVHLIHGPPGTGKSSTLVKLILSLAWLHQRIHVSATTNVATCELAMKCLLAASFQDSDDGENSDLVTQEEDASSHPGNVQMRYSEFVILGRESCLVLNDTTKLIHLDHRKKLLG